MTAAPHDEFFLYPLRVRRAFDRASRTYDAAAGVQSEIRSRLLSRLDIVRLQPEVVLDLGAGTGHASRELKQRYRSAEVIALDLSAGMLREAEKQQRFLRRFRRVIGDAHRLPLKDQSVDLVFGNLLLEWCHDPDAVFREIRRVLKPRGLLTFTTLGPDTLKELRDTWRCIDSYVHVHRFIDMHDLGDALVRAQLAEPVMDTERLTITYPDVQTLTRELRESGASNIASGRPSGLIGRARRDAWRGQSERLLRNGVLPISVEVVYGHAWAGEVRATRPDRAEILIPVHALRRPRS